MTPPRLSPLDGAHRALGARMVCFGGWEMPLSYPLGTVAEHLACRRSAVVFDVSHLGSVAVTGPGAHRALQWALTNDLARVEPGRAQYSHLLDPADASVEDDVIVWWLGPETFHVMPNASNTAAVVGALGEAPGDPVVADVTGHRAVLAVQGPVARARLSEVVPAVAGVAPFTVREVGWRGQAMTVAGTGYTGEDGVECALAPDAAGELWSALLEAGVAPAGLGARDTLRLEAGLPLHGHELGPGITPLQAGLGWVVGWDKGDFRGRAPLEDERRRGPARRLAGLVVDGRRPPRHGCDVLVEGERRGSVTSGNFSPTLGRGVALALLPPGTGPGTPVEVDVRGRLLPGEVVGLPFVARAPAGG